MAYLVVTATTRNKKENERLRVGKQGCVIRRLLALERLKRRESTIGREEKGGRRKCLRKEQASKNEALIRWKRR